MSTRAFYQAILSHFPQKHMPMAFAYGSGVFQQLGHKDMSKNMVDFIFVVDNPIEWHKENLEKNRSHYSFLKYFGANNISRVQDIGARVYFNTEVSCEGRRIKYGVISTQALRRDLMDWETLYISGRLHKPVYHVISETDHELEKALQTNRESAVHTALLLLPDQFKEETLYETITSLSYTGDLRMKFGEDKNKVKNIVKPNMDKFREMYEPIFEKEEHVEFLKSQGMMEQSSRIHHLNLLPKSLTDLLVDSGNKDKRHRDAEDVLQTLANDYRCRYIVRESVANIVKGASTPQSIKGIFTAGLCKSVKYSWNKIHKMMKSKKQDSNL